MIDFAGGRTRTRTLDPLIKSQLLYRLSYAPALLLRRGAAERGCSSKAGSASPATGLFRQDRWAWRASAFAHLRLRPRTAKQGMMAGTGPAKCDEARDSSP